MRSALSAIRRAYATPVRGSIGPTLLLLLFAPATGGSAELAPQRTATVMMNPLEIITARADVAAERADIPTAPHRNNTTTFSADETDATAASADEIFGQQGGYIHPYLSLKGEWTDNLYNVNVDEVSNLLTVASPGIWVGFPAMQEIPVSLSPHNTAIGGTRFSVPGSSSFDRFQAYLLGGLDYKYYAQEPDLNYTAWRLEGLFQYNLPADISFRIMDRFTRDRDRYDIGSFLPSDFTVVDDTVLRTSLPSRIRDYYSNQATMTLRYDMTDKYQLLLDYTHFYLDYDEEVNAWLDRLDNRYAFSLKYNYSPKTSIFLEYNFADIRYNTDNLNNSDNTFYYGGLTWKGTAKTSLMAKGGYQLKKYTAADRRENDAFSMELDFSYLITDKTKITLDLYKALEETDSITSSGKDTFVTRLRYNQNFSLRLRGSVEFWYEISQYEQFDRPEFEEIVDDRRDDRFLVRPAVQYLFRDWLVTEMAYSFENRDSSDNFFDFTTHTLYLTLSASF